jgi:hypothetical protein
LLFDELALHLLLEHHQQLEHLSLKQQFNAQSDIASSLLLQPHAQSLRAFPVSFGGLCVGSEDQQQSAAVGLICLSKVSRHQSDSDPCLL